MAIGGFLAVVAVMAEPYRRERLLAFLDPWSDPNGAGFQSVQAQVALGSGGVSGVGLGDGVQKAFYLPEAHTDMILATVGEELGLLGVVAVLVAFALFAAAGYRIALRAKDLHQQALAAGLMTLVLAQAAINIGAVVGVMPAPGVAPFVSFGGSSLIVLLACTGLLVNIGRRSHSSAGLAAVPGRAGADRRRRDGGHVMPALAVADALRAGSRSACWRLAGRARSPRWRRPATPRTCSRCAASRAG